MIEERVRRVAVVLFEGFTVLDVYGPVQAFTACRVTAPGGGRRHLFDVFAVAESPGPVQSGDGLATHADHLLTAPPPFDILLVPGGFGTRREVDNPAFIEALGAASRRAAVTVTVCTGAALLARTGRLDGRPATSNKIAWDWVVGQGRVSNGSAGRAGSTPATSSPRPASRPGWTWRSP